MALTVNAYKVNVTRNFSGGGSTTNEVIVLADSSGSVAEQAAKDVVKMQTIPTSLEVRRVTSVTFTYVGPA